MRFGKTGPSRAAIGHDLATVVDGRCPALSSLQRRIDEAVQIDHLPVAVEKGTSIAAELSEDPATSPALLMSEPAL